MKGSVRARGRGRWLLTIELGKDPHGKRLRECHTFRGTKSQADAELVRLLHELESGEYVARTRLTVAEFLDRWLADYAATNTKPTTYERYGELAKHVKAHLGHHLLAKLTPLHIQGYYTFCLTQGRRKGTGAGRGLSPQTVLNTHRMLRAALQRAVKWRLLAVNPADGAEPPRVERAEPEPIPPDQVLKFLEATEGTWLYLVILMAALTGARRGEVLGIRWDMVNLETGALRVRQALAHTQQGGLQFQSTKTRRQRPLHLPEVLVGLLRAHREAQEAHRARLGDAYQDHGLVLCAEDGSPVKPDWVTRAFARIADEVGLPDITFHDLRHAHASLMIALGIHMKTISARLGHSSIQITMDLYGHLLPGVDEDAAAKIDGAYRRLLTPAAAPPPPAP